MPTVSAPMPPDDAPMTDGRTRARCDRDARRAACGMRHAARPWYRRLGPGLLAGASDDDPSGTAVYAQAGSRYGFHLLWLLVVVLPMMVEVQLAAACVGRGRYREGVVAAIRRHYAARFAKTLIAPVVVVNVICALYWSARCSTAWRRFLLDLRFGRGCAAP
ncbi:hypothetical protein WT05_33185 [Burkholderia stagnalis]|nr:hypothetical protein WT05_33185 [Burkholderia stagnalis]